MKHADQLRHVLKTISWRIVGTIDTIFVSYLITGSVKVGMTIGGFEVFTKMILYYFHERVWYKYVSLGRARLSNPPSSKIQERPPIKNKKPSHPQKYQKFIIPQNYTITHNNRISRNKHQSKVFWMTGLSGSGKSTIANALQNELFHIGCQVYVLDGDNIRGGLSKDIDFSDSGRMENIRRVSEVAKLFSDAGFIVITAFISPFKTDRQQAKEIIGQNNFCEVYIKTPIAVCEKRDVKGLYKKARAGEIKNFTGIDSVFEEPENPDIFINTPELSIPESVALLKNQITLISAE